MITSMDYSPLMNQDEAELMSAFRGVFMEVGLALFNSLALPDFDLLRPDHVAQRAVAHETFLVCGPHLSP